MTRILINGIDGQLGARVAQLLSVDPAVDLIGLGRITPPAPIGRAEWLEAHLTGRQLVELLRAEQIEVVVHLAFAGAERRARSREEAIQQNVLGTMELLGACAQAGVRRIVLRSHAFVYGASPLNPTLITEDRPVVRSNAPDVLRDFSEVEQFIAEFAPQHPALTIVPVRCAPVVGSWSPINDYLHQRGPRMLVGFDPCIQLLHVEDAASAFALAARAQTAGPFNVATADTLCLSQAIKLTGQQPIALFEPVVALTQLMGNQQTLRHWPYDVGFLRHSCLVDTRRATCELGWAPTRGAAESLHAPHANGRVPEDQETSEAALRAFLDRRS